MSDEQLKGMQDDSDDVEGHAVKSINDEPADDGDVEGHALKSMHNEDDNLKGIQDDDDVEGHVLKS